LQLLTPCFFSTLAAIIFKSIAQVMPLTFTVNVFTLSAVAGDDVWEYALFAVAVHKIIATMNDLMKVMFSDFNRFHNKNSCSEIPGAKLTTSVRQFLAAARNQVQTEK